MTTKTKTAFLIVPLVIISGCFFLFFQTDSKDNDAVYEVSSIYQAEQPPSHSQQDRLNIRPDHYSVQSSSEKDDAKLQASANSKLQFEKNDLDSKENDSLPTKTGKIRPDLSESQIAIYGEEIAMKGMDIDIAYDDIANLSEKIDEISAELEDAEYAYIDAQRLYDMDQIDESILQQKIEKYEQLKMHLEDTETMLATKYDAIDEYENRIKELERLVQD